MQARTTIVVSTTNGGRLTNRCRELGGWMVDERRMDIGESLGRLLVLGAAVHSMRGYRR